MFEQKIITPEIATNFVADPEVIDLRNFTSIEDEAALLLSQYDGTVLDLSGLSYLSETAAQYLSEYSGQLKFSDLTTKQAIQNLVSTAGKTQLAINVLLGHLLSDLPDAHDQERQGFVSASKDRCEIESSHSDNQFVRTTVNSGELPAQRFNIIHLQEKVRRFQSNLGKASRIKIALVVGTLFVIMGLIFWELSSSQRWNSRGVEALIAADYPVAEASFKRAIEDNPNNTSPHRNLGVLYKLRGDLDAAQLCLRKALAIDPDYADAAFELGTVFKLQESWDEAIVQISSSILSGYDEEKAYYTRARCYQSRNAQGDILNAINDFSRVVEINSHNDKAYFLRASEYKEIAEIKKAIADVTTAISVKSGQVEYHKLRGNLYLETKEFKRAVNDFDKALQVSPDSPELLQLRAKAQFEISNTSEALKDLDRAIELDPSAQSYLLRAKIHLVLNEYSLAISDAAKAIYYNSHNPEAHRIKGLAESRYGNYEDAIENLTVAASAGLPSYELFMARGIANFHTENFGDAVTDFGTCIFLEPNAAESYSWQAKSHIARKQYDSALDDLDHAINISSTSKLYSLRAAVHSELGQLPNAIDDYSAAINLDDKQPRYFLERAKVYLLLKESVKSYDDFTTVISLDPKNIEALEKRANLGLRLMKYQESINDWTLYLAIKPGAANAFIGRARGYKEIMLYEEAIKDLYRAVSIDSSQLGRLARELAEWHQQFASTLEREGKYQNALSQLDKADQVFPEGVSASNKIRWICYLWLGHQTRNKTPLEAIVYYTKSINVNSEQYEAFHARGLLYGDFNEWDKALSDFSAALRQKVHDPEILVARGNAYLALEQFENALGDFSEAILIAPKNHDAFLGRAKSNFSLGKFDQCVADLQMAKELSMKLSANERALLVNAYVKHAEHLFELGEYAAVLKNIDNALEIDSKVLISTKKLQTESNYQLGLAEKSTNNSIEYFNRALAITDDHIPSRLSRASKRVEIQKVQEATGDFKYIISAPNSTEGEKMEAYWALAKLTGDFNDSRKYFDTALRLARKTNALDFTHISLEYSKRIFEDNAAEIRDLLNAIEILQNSKAPKPKLDAGLSDIYEKLASKKLSLVSKEDNTAAKELGLIIDYFMFAINYSPPKQNSLIDVVNSTRHNRSKILVRIGNFSEAINELEMVMRNSDKFPELLKHEIADAYKWRGMEQYNSGKWIDAIKDFQASHEMRDPTEMDLEREAVAHGRVAVQHLNGSQDGSPLGLLDLEKVLFLTTKIPSARELHQVISRQEQESAIDDGLADLSSQISDLSKDLDVSLRLPIPENEKSNIRTNAFRAVKIMEQGLNEEAIDKLSEIVNAGYPVAEVFYARAICYGLEGDNRRMDIDLKAGLFLESLGRNVGVGLDHGALFMGVQNRSRIKVEEFRRNVTPTILEEHLGMRKTAKVSLLDKLNAALDNRAVFFKIVARK